MTTLEFLLSTGSLGVFGGLIGKLIQKRKSRTEIDKLKAEVQKIKAEIMGDELNNIEKAVKIWRELAEGLEKTVRELQDECHSLRDEVVKLRKENHLLQADIKKLRNIIDKKH